MWLSAAAIVAILTFVVDLTTPRGVAAGVFPHFIAIGLTAWTSARLAPYILAALATVFTLIGFSVTEGGMTEIVFLNRVFLLATYWLVALLVHQKQVADWKLGQGHVNLEGIVEDRAKELEESEGLLRLITNRLPALVAYVNAQQRYGFINTYYENAIGVTQERAFGRHVREVLGDAAYKIVEPNIKRVLSGEVVRSAINMPTPNGERNFRVTYIPDQDASTEVAGFVLLALDVTDELELQKKLEQAQKLEAVGQLSGGIAHDFNNLLGVVIGNLELASDRADTEIKRYLDAALLAADGGASLTQRLLAFARSQPLQPAFVDINNVLLSMEELLVRTLGARIEIEIKPDVHLWPAFVDAHQLESAILNLALNARDALPEGGNLTITTQNHRVEPGAAAAQPGLTPGDYVSVSVSDNGAGIGPEALPRVFEPFYTTKEFGKGSGLGLAMVHGFANQSAGTVAIDSKLGEGTTVSIYLPGSPGSTAAGEREAAAEQLPPLGEGASVLVVEDNAAMRDVVCTMLGQLNYQVQSCATAMQGLVLLSNSDFDILLTDVILQGEMNGSQLADKVRDRFPGTAVVYMSGYTEDALSRQEEISVGSVFLKKPFHQDELARTLVLARQRLTAKK
jgi:PAS domain S-box-containing protein